MNIVFRKQALFVLTACLVSLVTEPSSRGMDGSDPVNQWQEAAFNYEYAAEAVESAAEELLVQVRYLGDTFQEDPIEARRSRIKSGQLQVRAASLMESAVKHREDAAKAWKQAAAAVGRDTASGQYFTAAANAASTRALSLLRQAVDLYERAALGFAEEEEYLSQASANVKAANIRERLARL